MKVDNTYCGAPGGIVSIAKGLSKILMRSAVYILKRFLLQILLQLRLLLLLQRRYSLEIRRFTRRRFDLILKKSVSLVNRFDEPESARV